MNFSIQRLRNLTTGRLHTEMGHIYEDLGEITGEDGLMTHMLPRAMSAVEPWLKEQVKDSRFWDGKYDTSHTGEIEISDPSPDERKEMFERFKAMPNPVADKEVIGIVVQPFTGCDRKGRGPTVQPFTKYRPSRSTRKLR